jgi:hypothetical protein
MNGNPPTLVLPPRHTPDSIALWRAATAAGWPVERLPGWRLPADLAAHDIVFYGEPLLAAVIGPTCGTAFLGPGVDWVARLPYRFRQRDVEFCTLAEARRLDRPSFVKPAEDKVFEAKIYASGADLPNSAMLPDETPVLVAEPVDWAIEWRSFVLEREVVTISPYLRRGALAQADDGSWPASKSELHDAQQFARRALADPAVDLPPAVVFDVGLIDGRGWAIVECNAAWGSGIYGCDAAQVLRCVRRACVRKEALTPAELRWAP